MTYRLRCQECSQGYTFATVEEAKAARCECGGTLRRVKVKQAPGDASSRENQPSPQRRVRSAEEKRELLESRPEMKQWTVVSEIASYAMKASLGVVALLLLSFAIGVFTRSGLSLLGMIACEWLFGLIILVEFVCFVLIAVSGFKVCGLLQVTVGTISSAVPMVLTLLGLMAAGAAVQKVANQNDMKLIGLGLMNLSSVHRKVPAAASSTADGKPLLSWRVHLLPYIEQQALYDQFHLDEPWDSPHNKTLIDRMPDEYRSAQSESGKTSYLRVVGERAIIPMTSDSSNDNDLLHAISTLAERDLMINGMEKVVLVQVPPAESVIWTQPGDWEFAGQPSIDRIVGHYDAGVPAMTASGKFEYIPNELGLDGWEQKLALKEAGP